MNRIFFFSILVAISSFSAVGQPEEQLFAHTDKECYLAGEILWFKLYVADAANHKPLSLSKSAFIELLSGDEKPILQSRIALDSGLGEGSFHLPFSLRSGHYLLRAYTNWMKNWPAQTWFQKPLTILNPLRDDLTAASPKTILPASAISIAAFDVGFFPEGGNLVDEVSNHLAFRIVDSAGQSRACTGLLIDAAGDTISRFHTLRFGMGDFTYTPKQNDQYKAVLTLENGPTLTYNLPQPTPGGYAMHLEDLDDRLRLDVQSSPTLHDSTLWLIIHTPTRSTTWKATPVSGATSFFIDKDALPAGISCLTVLNDRKIPVCERLWFIPPPTIDLSIRPDQASYGPREKITLQLSTTGPDSLPLHGSMAVVLQDGIQPVTGENIRDYLLLTSCLKGRVESPDFYFSTGSTNRREMTNLLLMTQGWRRFSTGLPDQPSNLPEYGGLIVTGHIGDRRTSQPIPGIAAWLSAPGQPFHVSRSVSDVTGNIQWDLGNIYGTQELVVQTGDSRTDSICRIEITSPFADSGGMPRLSYALHPLPADLLLLHSIAAQAQNAYQPTLRQKFTQPAPSDTTAFFGKPDKTYALDDYTRYTTMEEVMREFVKEVRLRNKKGDFEFHVQADQANQLFFESSPLILMDGVPISNVNNIIHFDPLKVRKIDIVSRRYVFGETIYDGIISYQTYTNDVSGFPLDGNAYVLDFEGLQLHREFFSPTYETRDQQESRVPDLRTTLFWSGDIAIDDHGRKQVSFYSSDLPGTYLITVQGITPDGQVGIATATITLTPSRQFSAIGGSANK
jgi:hypothetical protein